MGIRETSPVGGMSVEECLALLPDDIKQMVAEIRRQKTAGERPRPSTSLIGQSNIFTKDLRGKLLDKVAELVDENFSGRSDLCLQFADLLNRALIYLQFPSRAVIGSAIYYSPEGNIIHEWSHAWVRVGEEVIDGNVDTIPENHLIPSSVRIAPYWGLVKRTPLDRKLRTETGIKIPNDTDVNDVWWPDLKTWLEQEFR